MCSLVNQLISGAFPRLSARMTLLTTSVSNPHQYYQLGLNQNNSCSTLLHVLQFGKCCANLSAIMLAATQPSTSLHLLMGSNLDRQHFQNVGRFFLVGPLVVR